MREREKGSNQEGLGVNEITVCQTWVILVLCLFILIKNRNVATILKISKKKYITLIEKWNKSYFSKSINQ